MMGSAYVDASRQSVRRRNGGAMAIAAIAAMRAKVALWRERGRYRRALARMSERELADIGVSWSDIANEASKPFWHA